MNILKTQNGILLKDGNALTPDGIVLPEGIGVVDLSNRIWSRYTGISGKVIYTNQVNDLRPGYGGILSTDYYNYDNGLSEDKGFTTAYYTTNHAIQIRNDSEFSTAEEFAKSMKGIYLFYHKTV